MAQIEDLIAAYTLGSVAGLDTGTGKRDVDLKDPLAYTDTEIEDVPLPDDLIYVTRGEGLDKKEYVGNKDREMNFLKRAALGVLDAVVDNTKAGGKTFRFDYDRQNLIPKDEYNEKRLLETQRKADLDSGDATLTKQEAIDSLAGRRVLDEYEIQKMQAQRKDQFDYLMAAYPQLAGMINDEIFDRRMQIEYNSPSEIQKRLNASRSNYVGALLGRSQAQANIANAAAKGLDRYSGIRVT
jgi:hypothetical protein